MIVVCDTEVAAHLALALETYGRLLRDAGREPPVGLVEAARQIRFQVTGVQGGSFADALTAAVDSVSMDERVLLPYDEAAHRLGVSKSTVKRLVADGKIKSVKVASASRIHRDDLDAYADGLRRPLVEHKASR